MDRLHVAPSDSVGREDFETTVSKCLVRLFKPIARLCFDVGLTHRTITNAARRAFVEVASSERSIAGKAPTYSRISLLTGIDRKQVVEILGAPRTQVKVNPAAEIVDAWAAAGGDSLPLKGSSGDTFQSLVRKHCADLSYTTLLEHLVSTGTAEKRANNLVALRTTQARPGANHLKRFRAGLGSIASAANAVVTAIRNGRGSHVAEPVTIRSPALDPTRRAAMERDLNAAIGQCRQILGETMARYGEVKDVDASAISVALYRYTDS